MHGTERDCTATKFLLRSSPSYLSRFDIAGGREANVFQGALSVRGPLWRAKKCMRDCAVDLVRGQHLVSKPACSFAWLLTGDKCETDTSLQNYNFLHHMQKTVETSLSSAADLLVATPGLLNRYVDEGGCPLLPLLETCICSSPLTRSPADPPVLPSHIHFLCFAFLGRTVRLQSKPTAQRHLSDSDDNATHSHHCSLLMSALSRHSQPSWPSPTSRVLWWTRPTPCSARAFPMRSSPLSSHSWYVCV